MGKYIIHIRVFVNDGCVGVYDTLSTVNTALESFKGIPIFDRFAMRYKSVLILCTSMYACACGECGLCSV